MCIENMHPFSAPNKKFPFNNSYLIFTMISMYQHDE